eukprot:7269135-Alexandrium_andersonii.AAC.1
MDAKACTHASSVHGAIARRRGQLSKSPSHTTDRRQVSQGRGRSNAVTAGLGFDESWDPARAGEGNLAEEPTATNRPEDETTA